MTMRGTAMMHDGPNRESNADQTRSRNISRKFIAILGGLMIGGGVIGYMTAANEANPPTPFMHYMQLIVAVAIMIVVMGGAWRYFTADGPQQDDLDESRNVGLARFWDNRRKYHRVIGGLMLGGGLTGAVVGLMLSVNDFNLTTPTMKVMAVAAVAAFLITVTWGSWKYFTTVDELEVDANKWAGLIGINFYATLWMCWWALGKVELTRAPDGDAVFLLTMLVTIITFLWRRFR
ncbi:hypothetical protein [Sphingomonas sp.]|uniref:hypothetical protein n=1 Tax=Sphingomonas sp. TaxID=28214 RepID=UPI003D6CEAE6